MAFRSAKLFKFIARWRSSKSIIVGGTRRLVADPVCFRLQVHWFQQQHEKKRKKRDFGAASYPFAGYQPFFSDFGPRPRQAALFHRQRNRGVPLQNLFTDPLFKEQWYLVSTSCRTDRRDRIRDGNRTNSTRYLSRSTFPIISFSFSRRIYRWCQFKKFIRRLYLHKFSDERNITLFITIKNYNWRCLQLQCIFFVDIVDVVRYNIIIRDNKNR